MIVGRALRRDAERQPRRPRRQRASRSRLREGAEGHRALDADEPRRRPRRRRARRRRATRRRPAGNSSATCSTPAWRRSAARRAPAPAPTTCARRTASGRCCSGSTSSPRGRANRSSRSSATTGAASAATSIRATTTRASTRRRASALIADLRAQLASLPGRSFERGDGGRSTVVGADDFAYTDPVDGSVTTQPGHPRLLRRRCADRLSPVGNRHRRRDAAGSTSSASSPIRRGKASRRRPRSRR